MFMTLYGIVSLEDTPILAYWMPLGINSFAQMQPHVGIPLLDLATVWLFLSFLGYFSLLGRSPMRRQFSEKKISQVFMSKKKHNLARLLSLPPCFPPAMAIY